MKSLRVYLWKEWRENGQPVVVLTVAGPVFFMVCDQAGVLRPTDMAVATAGFIAVLCSLFIGANLVAPELDRGTHH